MKIQTLSKTSTTQSFKAQLNIDSYSNNKERWENINQIIKSKTPELKYNITLTDNNINNNDWIDFSTRHARGNKHEISFNKSLLNLSNEKIAQVISCWCNIIDCFENTKYTFNREGSFANLHFWETK